MYKPVRTTTTTGMARPSFMAFDIPGSAAGDADPSDARAAELVDAELVDAASGMTIIDGIAGRTVSWNRRIGVGWMSSGCVGVARRMSNG
jgi:hypothetical protein